MKRLNIMVAATVGTTLEWYDFFLFGACAILVFDKAFFSANDPIVASLLALGTFSAGFARPLGGILFGIAGDLCVPKTQGNESRLTAHERHMNGALGPPGKRCMQASGASVWWLTTGWNHKSCGIGRVITDPLSLKRVNTCERTGQIP
jgi:hypothetical protein